jgi:prepilin-type N-terminal cleavage/methylation domain-containing protein
MNTAQSDIALRAPRLRSLSLLSRKAYTMSEIIIVIVVLGLLASVAVPVYNNIRAAGVDNVKQKNADMLNQMATTVHNGGFDTSAWTDATTAINGLRAGISIASGATTMTVRLEKVLNAAAYTYTPSTVPSRPGVFAAVLGQPSIDP